jgi:hypothetical protein
MYLALHDNFISPLPSRDRVAVRHFRWITDLARLGGLVRNDGFGELCHSFRREKGFLRS